MSVLTEIKRMRETNEAAVIAEIENPEGTGEILYFEVKETSKGQTSINNALILENSATEFEKLEAWLVSAMFQPIPPISREVLETMQTSDQVEIIESGEFFIFRRNCKLLCRIKRADLSLNLLLV